MGRSKAQIRRLKIYTPKFTFYHLPQQGEILSILLLVCLAFKEDYD